MADKKGQNIVIKRIQGGGHGHHGGAWKVAYADFVTAMMCFFLVMWLMGSDEETKQAVAQSFQDPSTSVSSRADTKIELGMPSGKKANAGQESLLSGMGGAVSEDLVQRPQSLAEQNLQENQQLKELAEELFEGQVYGVDVNIDAMRFSIPDHVLFKPNSIEFSENAKSYLNRLGQLFKGYTGNIKIEAHTSPEASTKTKYASDFEYSLAKSVAIMNYMVENRFASEDRLIPSGMGSRRAPASNSEAADPDVKNNKRIEFNLTQKSIE